MQLIEVTNTQFKGYQKEEIAINNHEITLHAAYYTPKQKEDLKGALVIVHGSAPTTHEDVTYYTRIGTRLGMAVLAYDKRGVGKSEGQYRSFTVEGSKKWFRTLASDVLACYTWLYERPELKDKKIGLLGGSQAGWIMPLAASQNSNINFIVIGEGVAVSAGEENYFSQLTGDGDQSGISIEAAHEELKKFSGEKGFDPRNLLRELNTPTLWILGTDDPVIPVDATLGALQDLNNPAFQIELLENGNHDFVNTKTGKSYDLLEVIKPWLTDIKVLQ